MSFGLCPRIPHRLWVSSACILFMVAGAFGCAYAIEPGRFWSLAVYVACLSASTWMMISSNPISASQDHSGDVEHAHAAHSPASIGEKAGLSASTLRFVRSQPISEFQTSSMVQQSLDLDGLEALRSLDRVTAQWLVSDASDKAARIVRMACLGKVHGGEPEIERVERWFDIADGLRSRECRSLPKAELRRSLVADLVGVSKEQVRQIDQGRYVPLNRLLEAIDPKTL